MENNSTENFLSKASEIGKIIVNKCLDKGININTQKLQKLLILIQLECIKDSGYPLFSEKIVFLEDNAIIREVDEEFRKYGICFSKTLEEKLVLLYSEIEYIDNILNKFARLSSFDLNCLCLSKRKCLEEKGLVSDKTCDIYRLSDKTMNSINNIFEDKLGMSYEEFDKLDFDEQQGLIKENRETNKTSKSDYVRVMVGSGEHSTFINVKRGERVMLDDGTFIIAGETPEKSEEKINEKLDKIINESNTGKSKILSLFKKINRRF